MFKLMNTRRGLVLTITVVLLALVAWLGVTAIGNSATAPAPLVIAAASPATLHEAGISLTAPQASAIAASAAAPDARSAVAVAKQDIGDRGVRQTVLAHCQALGLDPQVDQDCWVVSLDPAGFHSHGPGTTIDATYLLTFVDPGSGRVLFSEAGAPEKS